MSLPHPNLDQINLSNVLAALGDETRLAIVSQLARNNDVPMNCWQFLELSSRTNLSYHFAKLREAGITLTEVSGTSRLISLRRAELDRRFPGLLDAIVETAQQAPVPDDQAWRD
ncbi:MAG TPA: helix-turn-helix transcriptional regulator [Ensifer sp.]|jgi:DNA-binding transcriptional ArsR family regulator|uniref:ArsR/SmtB family transcription factor n=1 Tax=Ensifer sp. TaxID=1872086 RepID=UPI002E16390B|nr:helix-turn-helix transcriptional regulator [Ensifer sp.]